MSRTLSVHSPLFTDQDFSVVQIDLLEAVNTGCELTLVLKQTIQTDRWVSPSPINLTEWLHKSCGVQIEIDGKQVGYETVGAGIRYLQGIITRARFLYDKDRVNYYEVIIEPPFALAKWRANYRIFQDTTVLDIIDTLVMPYQQIIKWRLFENYHKENVRYPNRDFVCQYAETDWEFFVRLCSEWGLNYWFEHNESGVELIVGDSPMSHRKTTSEAYHQLSYYPPNHKTTEEYLHEFKLDAQVVSGAYAHNDYNYDAPRSKLLTEVSNPFPFKSPAALINHYDDRIRAKTALTALEVYQYASDVSQPRAGPSMSASANVFSESQMRAQWNLEREQQDHFTAQATGHIRGLAVGCYFQLDKHPNPIADGRWVIGGQHLVIKEVAQHTESKGLQVQHFEVSASLNLTPLATPIRPTYVPKPVANLHTAVVVGVSGASSLTTDWYGRIKVQFHWDRDGTLDENSTCWIRVNQPWAGNEMGAVFIPRHGQEVIVSFINNDPDLPICMGRVYNESNLPPWKLTENQSLSGFRTRELPQGNAASGRSNHLVFDDTEGHIQTQLKSDHAHSSLSLGDIHQIKKDQGRQEARGQGFELRTDDWGSVRAAKGLYVSTYPRTEGSKTSMDSSEAYELLKKAQILVDQLSALAKEHRALGLDMQTPLQAFTEAVKTPAVASEGASPEGFERNLLLSAAQAGAALVTPENIHHYAGDSHLLSTGKDTNMSVGQDWVASVGRSLSYYVQNDVQVVAGTGRMQIQAHDNTIDICADQSLTLSSARNQVQITADTELTLACQGAYIRFSGGDILIHAPGKLDFKGASHSFQGPGSLALQRTLPKQGQGQLELLKVYGDPNATGYAQTPYRVTDSQGVEHQGVLDQRGYALVTGLAAGGAQVVFGQDPRDPSQDPHQFKQSYETVAPLVSTLQQISGPQADMTALASELGPFVEQATGSDLGAIQTGLAMVQSLEAWRSGADPQTLLESVKTLNRLPALNDILKQHQAGETQSLAYHIKKYEPPFTQESLMDAVRSFSRD